MLNEQMPLTPYGNATCDTSEDWVSGASRTEHMEIWGHELTVKSVTTRVLGEVVITDVVFNDIPDNLVRQWAAHAVGHIDLLFEEIKEQLNCDVETFDTSISGHREGARL